MMKKIMMITAVLVFLLAASTSVRAQQGKSVLDTTQSAAQGSVFEKMGDWFSTVGKSTTEKDQILEKRQLERVQAQTTALLESYKQAGQTTSQDMKGLATNEVDALKAKFKDEVAKAEAAHASEIAAAKAKYEELLARSDTKENTRVESAKARFNDELTNLKAELQAQAAQMKDQVTAQVKDKARRTADQTVDRASAQIDAYQRQLATQSGKPLEKTKGFFGDFLK